METSNSDSSPNSINPNSGTTSSFTPLQFPSLRFLHSPISSLLDYSGLLRARPDYSYSEARNLLPNSNSSTNLNIPNSISTNSSTETINGSNSNSNNGEVSIRIDDESDERVNESGSLVTDDGGDDAVNGTNGDGVDGGDSSNRETMSSSSQRYDIQRAARWVEKILPFLLLLLVVFIRQHLQGFVVAIYVTAILFKSNDILRKQTALKGERKTYVLVCYPVIFMLHVSSIYWWNREDEIFYPFLMIPPKAVPPFWHAIYIIVVNDIMVRQGAMVLKFFLLMYYKNARGHNFRRQGQMLTLVEYTLLLYRALLPTPVWYKFFLNNDYGSIFSVMITGLYLTFKLTSIVEKVHSFISALKALSRKEINYGSYATQEQVNAADLCAICQEKMHTPILLSCKHMFCEDCVSEWFERERTCPLCRALVRPADLQSYGDGSTSLYFQLF